MPEAAVSVEEHRLMVEHRIAVRKDGTFGFKKRCANEACDLVVDERCYCAPTLQEALAAVKQRSSYYHSRRCGLEADPGLNHAAWEYLHDLAGPTAAEWRTPLERALFGLVKQALKHEGSDPPAAPWWTRLRAADHRLADVVEDVFDEEMDEWDPDGDGDEGECACDVEGGKDA
jgi:hypothetical protein